MSESIFQDNDIEIVAVDEADASGAHHHYTVLSRDDGQLLGEFKFQKGPIGEVGVNGIQHDHILAIVENRLDGFQRGPYKSMTNEVSCGFVSAARASEGTRTRRRRFAGVEGRNAKALGVESAS